MDGRTRELSEGTSNENRFFEKYIRERKSGTSILTCVYPLYVEYVFWPCPSGMVTDWVMMTATMRP